MDFRDIRTDSLINDGDASPVRQPKIQSSLVREILQRIMGKTNQQRLQISDPHFVKFTTPANVCLLEDQIRN